MFLFILYSLRLFDKFFTFEKINTFIFFSLNQNFRNFAIKIIKSGREEVKFTREDKHS